MLDFALRVSADGSIYSTADLFPEQQLDFEIDFYDSLDIDSIKMPFYTDMKLPLTAINQSANIFNFAVATASGDDFPRNDFFFKLDVYGDSGLSSSIAGILNVKHFEYNSGEPYIQIELTDQISHYLSKAKGVNMSELYTQTAYTSNYALVNFANLAQGGIGGQGGQAGAIGVQPDSDAAIIFPYVDMNNDTDSLGYAQRAFLEYGVGIGRTGLVPAFSVPKFLEYLGDYLTAQTIDVRVDSKLFGVGSFAGSPYDADMQPEKLRFINDSHMLANVATNTRTFTLQQALAWVGTNSSMENIYGLMQDTKMFTTGYWGNMEISGNAGGVSTDNWNQATWGAKRTSTSYPAENNDTVRGWFCPKVSYQSNVRLNGNPTLVAVQNMSLEIPVAKEDELVGDIILTSSDMTFTPYVGIYEDGFMLKKVALTDSNGDNLVLSPTGKTQGESNKTNGALPIDYFADNGDTVFWQEGASATFNDTLTFGTFIAYFPTDVDVFVNAGSRYSTNYFMEPVDGTITLQVATSFVSAGIGTNTDVMNTSAFRSYVPYDLKKLITRLPNLTEAGKLDITLLASEDFLPHNSSDMINIKSSISKTTTDTIYDVLLKIIRRFNCNLLYDFDSTTNEHVLRVDPIHIARSGAYDANALVDDSQSVKISEGGSKIKNLILNNEDYDGFYDDLDGDKITVGSTTQVINEDAKDDKKIDFDSSIFFKSVCGVETFERPVNLESGAFSSRQLGLASNIHAANKDIGFRFAYVKPQNYVTNVLHPYIVFNKDLTFSGAMKTETERIWTRDRYVDGTAGFGELSGANAQMIFNGELTHVNAQGWDLRASNDSGVLTDYYDLYSAGEALLMANNSVIEFDMVVPTADLGNLDFFLQTMTATIITPNDIYVKSAKGKVYGDYAYLTIEGLIN